MTIKDEMIVIQDIPKTLEIEICEYVEEKGKWRIRYNKGTKDFYYNKENVHKFVAPVSVNANKYCVSHKDIIFNNIEAIYEFGNESNKYWRIYYENKTYKEYIKSELHITTSCLEDGVAKRVFAYLKEIAETIQLPDKEVKDLLFQRYQSIDFVREDTVLARYLNPLKSHKMQINKKQKIPIYPFGCNLSQREAIEKALNNQISIIQGPPGTGKTQTILNIIANILIDGKTVQIVSQNDSAIRNVQEKMKSYGIDFVSALLGKCENREMFIDNQTGEYPDLSLWAKNRNISLSTVEEDIRQLQKRFETEKKLANYRQELKSLRTEFYHFQELKKTFNNRIESLDSKNIYDPGYFLKMWMEILQYGEKHIREDASRHALGLLFRLRCILHYRVGRWKFYKQDIFSIITAIQEKYYKTREQELNDYINNAESFLNDSKKITVESLCEHSQIILQNYLVKKYYKLERPVFNKDSFWKGNEPYNFLTEYPVILSTTFSSTSSFKNRIIYDYLIIDEASQVDIVTGALALSSAKNVVIVGDTKQLPNVVTSQNRARTKTIFEKYKINAGYNYTYDLLQSFLKIMPNVPQTLLKEHYRCHPTIINFCNQKFYNGELIPMTKDNGEKGVISIVETVKGNHARIHYNQRQIDVIEKEVLPKLKTDETSSIGIIAPYNEQTAHLEKEFPNIEVHTVHKFQGREKDNIIISTVDNIITDFVDNPNLVNVAVSRAKKKLIVVVSGNEQPANRNISDLIAYAKYNNGNIEKSNITSVFDYLYSQYREYLEEYNRRNQNKISRYPSENLMFDLIEEVIEEEFSSFGIICHQPLRLLINDMSLLAEREYNYVSNPCTHVDFVIYNKLSKLPVCIVEVDGYAFHKKGTKQHERDKMKNNILHKYNIPWIRFATNGSGEKERLIDFLRGLI